MDVLHVVWKKENHFTTSKLSKDKPIGSLWVLLSKNEVLHESGFDEFPWATPRFTKNPSEVYGRGPGTTALKNIIHLNNIESLNLKAAQLTTMPPLFMRRNAMSKPINRTPGSMNFVNNMNDVPKPLDMTGNVHIGENAAEEKKQEIADAFYYNIIMVQKQAQMTATEALINQDERNRIMVGINNRLENEFLRPVVDRVLGILSRKGLLKPVPEHLKDAELDIEFTSPLKNANQTTEALGLVRWMETWGNFGPEMAQQMFQLIDLDKAGQFTAEAFNVPLSVMKLKSEIRVDREDLQREQAAAQQAQALPQMAQAARDLASAENQSGEGGTVKQAIQGIVDGS